MERFNELTGSQAALEHYVFRNLVTLCLRSFCGYMVEAEAMEELQMLFGKDFVVADESAAIDSAIMAAEPDCPDRVRGCEIKSLTMHCRVRVQRENMWLTGPTWQGRVSLPKTRQAESDVFSVHFPLLRVPEWRAVIDPQTPGYSKVKDLVRFQQNDASQRLDHVVPTAFWPSMTTKEGSIVVLEKLRAQSGLGSEEEIVLGDFRFQQRKRKQYLTKSILENPKIRAEKAAVALLRSYLGDIDSFEVKECRYHPVTGDFKLQHGSGRSAFVEVKMGFCKVEGEYVVGQERRFVSHLSQDPRKPGAATIFSYTSGRWAYLLTSCGKGSDDIYHQGVMVPRYALLIHRNDIPRGWWYPTVDPSRHWLSGWVESSFLLDLRKVDAVGLAAWLHADVANGRFGLPALEKFDLVPHGRLTAFYAKAAAVAARYKWTPDLSNIHWEGTSQGRHLRYGAWRSLDMLHACREIGKGLIYDWQANLRYLRSYAFTTHTWSPDDVTYNLARPRRTPNQIFELPPVKRYAFLVFSAMKHDDGADAIYVPGSLAPMVKACGKEHDIPTSQRLFVLSHDELAEAGSLASAVYVIPEDAIEISEVSTGRFIPLRLAEKRIPDDFRFDDLPTFLSHLHDLIQSPTVNDNGDWMITFKGYTVVLSRRHDIYEVIRHRLAQAAEQKQTRARKGASDQADSIIQQEGLEGLDDDDWMIVVNKDFMLA